MSFDLETSRRAPRSCRIGLLVALAIGVLLLGCEKPQKQKRKRPPPKVTTALPLQENIIEWDEYTGRFAAIEYVEVNARVSGYLESIHFEDGAMVDKGDLLFVIDPRPFEAALERAKGDRRQAKARHELAEVQFARTKQLFEEDAVSHDDYDEQLARTRQAEGELESARAAVRAAELDLEFTRVRSPIRGRISRHLVTEGNLVQGGVPNPTLLTTIVSLDPIYFFFDVNERTYLKYIRLAREGKRPSSRRYHNPVLARLAADEEFAHKGHMNFVDSTLDRQTGTMRARAVFPNPDLIIAPGMFARIRVPGNAAYDAILLPGKAVGRDQTRRFVRVVRDDNTIERRPVELGPRACGLRIVRSGLKGDETVVIEGLQKARPEEPVNPSQTEISLPSDECLSGVYERVPMDEGAGSDDKKESEQE